MFLFFFIEINKCKLKCYSTQSRVNILLMMHCLYSGCIMDPTSEVRNNEIGRGNFSLMFYNGNLKWCEKQTFSTAVYKSRLIRDDLSLSTCALLTPSTLAENLSIYEPCIKDRMGFFICKDSEVELATMTLSISVTPLLSQSLVEIPSIFILP